MAELTPRGIRHTIDTTFDIYAEIEGATAADTLEFIVAREAKEKPLIDKTFNFTAEKIPINLTQEDLRPLEIGEYIFKMIYQKNGIVKCVKSGDFNVVWGCSDE